MVLLIGAKASEDAAHNMGIVHIDGETFMLLEITVLCCVVLSLEGKIRCSLKNRLDKVYEAINRN